MAALLIAAATAFAGPALGHHKPDHKVPPGHQNPPGQDKKNDKKNDVHDNRGTIKVHEGAGEPSPVMRNQPQVCEFHVHGFKFHAGQQVVVTIVGQGGPNVAGTSTWGPTTVTTDANGEFRTPASGSIDLTDGMYKVRVDTGRDTGRQDKQKVFKIDCPDEATPPANSPPSGGNDDNNPPNSPTGGNDDNNPPNSPTGGNDDNNPPAAPEAPPKPSDLPDTAMADARTEPVAVATMTGLLLLTIGGFAIVTRRRLAR